MTNPSRVMEQEYHEDDVIDRMWINSLEQISSIEPVMENWKTQVLPLARVKKIMKSEEVLYLEEEKERMNGADSESPPQRLMIKGEALVLMGKACELHIRELTMRSWRHTEHNRRRILRRIDVQAGIEEDEVYDYLVDIVPRLPEGVVSEPESVADYATDEHISRTVPSNEIRSPQTIESLVTIRSREVEAPAMPVTLIDQSENGTIGLAQLAQMHNFMVMQQQIQAKATTNPNAGLHNHAMNLYIPIPVYIAQQHVDTQAQWTAGTIQNVQDVQDVQDKQQNPHGEQKQT